MSDPIATACQNYRMLVIAHRLRKFGFEPSINLLSADDLEVLAGLLLPHQRVAVMREVEDRRATIATPLMAGKA